MAITAKVVLSSRTEYLSGHTLEFQPDYGDGRNAEWAASTPSLNLKMTVKPSVGQLFAVGQAYTLTFEPEPPAAAAEA